MTVNWDDEQYDKVSPYWDTHTDNFPRLKTNLCPTFDRAFAALLADLDERGLLETTLVVVTGEFGRTPKVGQFVQNSATQKNGRDHWPHAFTVLLAGGGVRGGRGLPAPRPPMAVTWPTSPSRPQIWPRRSCCIWASTPASAISTSSSGSINRCATARRFEISRNLVDQQNAPLAGAFSRSQSELGTFADGGTRRTSERHF